MKVIETSAGRVLLTNETAVSVDLLAEHYDVGFVMLLGSGIDPETFPLLEVETMLAVLQKAQGVTSQ